MSKILYLSFIVLFLALSFFLEMPPIIIGIIFLIMTSSLLINTTIVKKMTREHVLALTIGSIVSLVFMATIIFVYHIVASTLNINTSEILSKYPYTIYIFAAFIITKIYLIFSTTFSFLPEISNLLSRGLENTQHAKILDTSVIVDGRIADIAEKGFFDGYLIVPSFVIKEIQAISDSHDAQKRIRGRRALNILNRMKSSKDVMISITEIDFPKIKEVDLKLIELSKKMSAKVITNDFNLMKVAEIHDVDILNINELANMLYVTVLPGDILNIALVREGKEKQALAYLEDGTMIVVDNAKHLIGKDVNIQIGSILPKEAGRVIFATIYTGSPKRSQSSGDYKYKSNAKKGIGLPKRRVNTKKTYTTNNDESTDKNIQKEKHEASDISDDNDNL